MTGFNDLFVAIKPTNGGNYGLIAVMGPATNTFSNLSPVDAGTTLLGTMVEGWPSTIVVASLFYDSAQALTADVWNIFYITGTLRNQKLMQFKLTNNSGGESDIDFAYLRVV